MDAIDTVTRNHVRDIIKGGRRLDGRGLTDFRNIRIETGLIQNAEGSAQVDIGNTRVLAGVKLDVDEPMEDTPDQGNLIMSAELLPLASEKYETGPPSPDAIEFARVVDRGIRHGECFDLKSLFIEEGKVWGLFVDLYVLNYDGNLFDAGLLAAMSAIAGTRIPKYVNGKADREDRTARLSIRNMVSSATFAKIGKSIVLDPSGDEEKAADCRLTIATDGETVRAMQKGGMGAFTQKEIDELIGVSLNKHSGLKDMMTRAQV
jgi:exosome complex component RRP42